MVYVAKTSHLIADLFSYDGVEKLLIWAQNYNASLKLRKP